MKTQPDTLLLFGVKPEEKKLIDGLISSFEIDTAELSVATIAKFAQEFPDRKICLIVFHVDEYRPRQDEVIRLIRGFAGKEIPLLLLVPRQRMQEIDKYLKAGADDFIEIPFTVDRFSISFLILLELGQTMAHPMETENRTEEPPAADSGWQRLFGYAQRELSYFAPKSLIKRIRSENISAKWQLVRKLGQGGFGVVWLVREIGTGRPAVAKTPHSSQMNLKILRSAAILKRLIHHPNVVHLIEIAKDYGKLILIQEYVDGTTLQELLERGMSSLEKETYFLQLLSAVSYAHKHKILHRDIKPENIIVSKAGRLKLLDFGIARDLSWQVPDRVSEGTMNFMPPEQWEGKSCLASDVWALGVILYILATNAIPYYQQIGGYPEDIEEIVAARAPRRINPAIDPELERIILQCLRKDLQQRYQNATEIEDALRASFPQFGKGENIPE